MENIIEKINEKGSEIRNNKIKALEDEKELFNKRLEIIKSFGPRISKMWDIAQALRNNGFGIGEDVYNHGFEPFHKLETNYWYHWLGFFVRNGEVVGFGIEGGGACGKDFSVNKYGDAQIDFNRRYYWNDGGKAGPYWQYPEYSYKMKRIINEFDEYEKKFYEYVEKVLN